MLRLSCFLTAVAISAAAVAVPIGKPLTPAEKAMIQHAVRAELLDPDGAQFRLGADNVKAEKYCGLVNAKNSYGGYTGYKVFFIIVDRDAKGRIVKAEYPQIIGARHNGSDPDGLSSMLDRVTVDTCRENGFAVDY